MPLHSQDLDRQEAIRNFLATHQPKLSGFSVGLVVAALMICWALPIIGVPMLVVGSLMFFAGRHIDK